MDNFDEFAKDCVIAMSGNACVDSSVAVALMESIGTLRAKWKVTPVDATRVVGAGDLPHEVDEYLYALKLEGHNTEGMNNKRRVYKRFFDFVANPIAEVTAEDIRAFLRFYQETRGVQDVTLDHIRMSLSALFKWLVLNEYAPRNPVDKVSPIHYEKKERHALKRVEFEQFRNACRNPFELAVVDFMFSTGCRVNEVRGARLQDIDWNKQSIQIRMGKGKKDRTVYFSDRSALTLREYVDKYRKGDDPHLFTRREPPYTGFRSTGAFQRIIHKISNRCRGLSAHVTPHVLRHTFGTLAYQSGMKLEEVQVLMGHTSVDTTRIYAEIDNEDVRRAHNKYVV